MLNFLLNLKEYNTIYLEINFLLSYKYAKLNFAKLNMQNFILSYKYAKLHQNKIF